MTMALLPGDDFTDAVKIVSKVRKGLRNFLYAARQDGRFSLPLILSVGAVVSGLIGWSNLATEFSIKSIATIVINTILAFIPSLDRLEGGNPMTHLSALLGALTTFIGAILIAYAKLYEQILCMRARYLWSNHVAVIGDTEVARRLAADFQRVEKRIFHVVPTDAPQVLSSGPIRVRLGTDVAYLVDSYGLRFAKRIIIDLGSDTATLSAGRILIQRLSKPFSASWLVHSMRWLVRFMRYVRSFKHRRHRPDTVALRVVDPLFADQFFEVMGFGAAAAPGEIAPLRPAVFDDNRLIARHTLSQHPLFVLADSRGQKRVHAVIVGFGDLGEKVLDQIILTSIAGKLDAPRVTVIDRHGSRREREFRARRPAVLDTLDICILECDIGIDSLEDGSDQGPVAKLRELEKADGVTAIFVALPSDAETARAALLLRRTFLRTGMLAAPIFYRWRTAEATGDLLEAGKQDSGKFDTIRMSMPAGALLKEVADPDGREALARALHENYRQGENVSPEADKPWEQLPDTLHRANIRAADHLPAKLWSLGLNTWRLDPGAIPAIDVATINHLLHTPRSPDVEAKFEDLARLEHERWMIERKLDGWTHGTTRDNAKRQHHLLMPWEELKKSPQERAKDVDQVLKALQFVVARSQPKPEDS